MAAAALHYARLRLPSSISLDTACAGRVSLASALRHVASVSVDLAHVRHDVTGRKVAAPIRDKATDPHVKGPFETNWGFADWAPEEAQRIILALPDDIQ